MEQVIDHSERTHAQFSPSSLESRELCPGWESDSGETSVYAADGTRCHEACESLLQGSDTLLKELPSDLASFVKECYDYIAPRIAGAEVTVFETRIYPAHPLLKEKSFGTPDVIAMTGDTCQLLDEKYGRRSVTPAENNLQGWAYAISIWDTYDKIENITLHFVAPRINKGTTCFTFSRSKDYDRVLARVLRTVERAQANSIDDYNPSWSACCYCKRKATCEALTKSIERVYDLATDALSDVRLSEAVKADTPENLGFLKNAATLIEDWAKQQQERLKTLALEGHEVSGYEIRFAKGRTTVRTVDKVLAAGVDIPVEKITAYGTIPLADLRSIYTDGVPASDKKEKESELMTKLAKGGALKSGEDSVYLYRLTENN